jgi:3-oxoacyl-[acyl-carrier protein] reductase
MAKRRWGRVIHVSSISAKMLRGSIPIAVQNPILTHTYQLWAALCADTGVVISGVMPGAVEFPGGYWDKIRTENQINTMAS